MKKVLLVTHVSGFVPQFEMSNVKTLQEMGYEVHYASNYNKPEYGNDNSRLKGSGVISHQIDFARSPFNIIQNIHAYNQLCLLLKTETFELLHCHTPVGGAISRIAAWRCKNKKLKVIYTVHGFHFLKGGPLKNWILYYPVERQLARITDILVTINVDDYKIAKKMKLKKNGSVEKINGVGIDTKKFEELFSERHVTKHEGTIFLSIGELNENKNHKLVIEAMHRSNREDFKYVICGEGKNRNKIEKLINKYKLNDRVILMGYQKDIRQILVQADIFIMPSFREGLSVALQEAMASGLAAIVTDIRGNRDLIEPQKGGWLVNSNDVNSMINAMNMATCFDTRTIGLYNMKKIKDYDREKVALSMEVIYKKLLEEELC